MSSNSDPWAKTDTVDEYLRLMNTYSSHRALKDGVRSRLYEAVGELIEEKYEGKVERPYLTVAYLGKKTETE